MKDKTRQEKKQIEIEKIQFLNKVGIFSARTPNRFVGFLLVVEGELELGLSITARSVGRILLLLILLTLLTLGRITFYSTVDFFGLFPYYYYLLLLLTRGGGKQAVFKSTNNILHCYILNYSFTYTILPQVQLVQHSIVEYSKSGTFQPYPAILPNFQARFRAMPLPATNYLNPPKKEKKNMQRIKDKL